jgi:uncharacterized membrane protein YeaQ/YmgE (transglycosylase-associated protein family)
MSQNREGCLHHSIWPVIGALASVLALFFAIFIWFVPNYKVLFPDYSPATPTVKVTTSPTLTSITPTPTPMPDDHSTTSANFPTTIPSPWIWWASIGAVVGVLAYVVAMGSGIVIGYHTINIVGSIISACAGGFLMSLLGFGFIGSVVGAFVGSCIFVALSIFFTRRRYSTRI